MTKILYEEEHLSCPNYDSGDRPLIEEKYIEAGKSWQVQPLVNKIIFILEGKIEYSVSQLQDCVAHKGNIFFLPANQNLYCHAPTETHILVVRLYEQIQICDCFRLEDLKQIDSQIGKRKKTCEGFFALKANSEIKKYLEVFLLCHRGGLRCRYYNKGKIKELMFILRSFYPKEDLFHFFYPIITTDISFSQFVMDNYQKYNKLSQVAEAMNYSVSGFEKRFRKVFGCSPYKWRMERMAQNAFHLISTSNTNFKQISDTLGFKSPSSFSNFVKHHFGKTPGEIRQNRENGGNEQ